MPHVYWSIHQLCILLNHINLWEHHVCVYLALPARPMTCSWYLSDRAWTAGSAQRTDSTPEKALEVQHARCGPGRWQSSGVLCCHPRNRIFWNDLETPICSAPYQVCSEEPILWGMLAPLFSASHLRANGQQSHWKWHCLLFEEEEIVKMP